MIKTPQIGFYKTALAFTVSIPIFLNSGCSAKKIEPTPVSAANLAELCAPEALQEITDSLSTKVTVAKLPQAQIPGPYLPGGAKYTPAKGSMPAYCQVTGSYVTNPETGKTANFLATFPEEWNGKYLQLGCGGFCGTFAVSNPALPTITITNQGKPDDIISKGYASFATDEGHVGMSSGKWAIKGPGEIDEEAVDDLLYRAQKVLAKMGKEFTQSFYAQATDTKPQIAYSYFSGCSGGGRDALVAASYFPEEFDGIIAGSPAMDVVGLAFHGTGASLATVSKNSADVPPALIAQIDPIVKKKCDEQDGVKDGLIQNPMACEFRPETDLPRCANDVPGQQCFTTAQIKTISTVLTAVTDENGNLVQPGFSVSELQPAFRLGSLPKNPETLELWPDTGNPGTGGGGMGTLGNATLKVLIHKNDPEFHTRKVLSFKEGGEGSITGYRVIAPSKEVKLGHSALKMGIAYPEKMGSFINQDRKLLIWHNLSDQLLTPYMSVNFYNQLAKKHGGFGKLQKNVRLFSLPGTAHCSGGGAPVGPGSFDALSAMENWVEKDASPNNLTATLFQTTPFGVNFNNPLGRTMPLCKFPEMAKYKGSGDINDAQNWYCPEGDQSMLKVGASGRQAGVKQYRTE